MESAKYMTVVKWIKDNIEQQGLKPGDKIVSEMELCNIHGVSRQTVRQALNMLEQEGVLVRRQGSGTFVADASFEGGRKSKTVGVISTYFSDYIFPEIITGIEHVLSEHNIGMQLALTQNKVKNEEKALQSMLKQNVAALIVEPSSSALPNPNIELYNMVTARKIPLIFFNARYPWSSLPCMAMDDVETGRVATQCLIDYGHKRIAGCFISDNIQGHLRYKGFIQSIKRAGLEVDEDNILWYSSVDIKDLFVSPDRILARLKNCDAVVCYNDQLALPLIEFCRGHGIRVPEDLSVVGIDNSKLAGLCEVPLTSVEHPKKQLGEEIATAIMKLMHNPAENVERFYKPGLVVRNSVRRIG